MKHTEYIIPIGEDAQDYDEMFIGVIRRHTELIRCKDCKYCSVDRHADGNVPDYVCIEMDCGVEADGFCAWAVRRKENG